MSPAFVQQLNTKARHTLQGLRSSLMSPGGIKMGGGGVMVSSWKRLFSEVLKGDYFGLIGNLAFRDD